MLADRGKSNTRIADILMLWGTPAVWLLLYGFLFRFLFPQQGLISILTAVFIAVQIYVFVFTLINNKDSRADDPEWTATIVVVILVLASLAELPSQAPGLWRVLGAVLMALENTLVYGTLKDDFPHHSGFHRLWCKIAYVLLGFLAVLGLAEASCGLSGFPCSLAEV